MMDADDLEELRAHLDDEGLLGAKGAATMATNNLPLSPRMRGFVALMARMFPAQAVEAVLAQADLHARERGGRMLTRQDWDAASDQLATSEKGGDDTRCQNCQELGCYDGYFDEWVPYSTGMIPMPVRCDCEQEDCSCYQALVTERSGDDGTDA